MNKSKKNEMLESYYKVGPVQAGKNCLFVEKKVT